MRRFPERNTRGGFFRAHVDNTAATTRFRFKCSGVFRGSSARRRQRRSRTARSSSIRNHAWGPTLQASRPQALEPKAKGLSGLGSEDLGRLSVPGCTLERGFRHHQLDQCLGLSGGQDERQQQQQDQECKQLYEQDIKTSTGRNTRASFAQAQKPRAAEGLGARRPFDRSTM